MVINLHAFEWVVRMNNSLISQDRLLMLDLTKYVDSKITSSKILTGAYFIARTSFHIHTAQQQQNNV